jgi:sucrose-phosphate synthase
MLSELCYEQLELEGIQRISARRKEQEQVRREATEDLAEDLSEGEKGDTIGELAPVETTKKKFQRNFSDLTVWSDDNKEKKLYIVLIRSTHLHIVLFYVVLNW